MPDPLVIESFEIRPVKNGFVLILRHEDSEDEYIFDSHQKLMRFIKPLVISLVK